MKNFLINAVIFLLVLVGSLLVGWHFIQEDIILFFTQVDIVPEEFELNSLETEANAEFDWDAVYLLGAWDWLGYVGIGDQVSPIGELIIPSIGTRLPIFHGVGEPNISIGAGTVLPDAVIGEGNYTLASHWDPNPGIRFGGLDLVEIGDLLILRDSDYLYIYETIIANYVIDAYRSDITDYVEGKVLLTLFTCTADGLRRVMVRGEFVNKLSIADAAEMLAQLEDLTALMNATDLEVLTEVIETLDETAIPFPVVHLTLAVGGALILAGFVVWISNRGIKHKND